MLQMINRFGQMSVAAVTLAACTSLSPQISDGDGYQVTPVTPVLLSQLQHEQFDKYNSAAPPLSEASYSYRIGPADILFAKLYLPSVEGFDGYINNHYALSDNWQEYNEVIVKDDGNVSFPYVGEVELGGKTLPEAKRALDAALGKYFKEPHSVIEVKEFKSHKVQITGEVHKPGQQYLRYAPLHVLEAIDAAGGLQDDADLADASIIHKDGTSEKIDLFALMNSGHSSQNRILFDDDTLHVPANAGNKVFVLGEVNKPALQYIKAGHMTLMEALNSSEGLNSVTASYAQIYVIRGIFDNAPPKPASDLVVDASETTTPAPAPEAAPAVNPLQTKIYKLDSSTGDGIAMAAQFPLQPNDVVYVSPTSISEWNKFISLLLPYNATSFGSTAHSW